MTIDSVETIGFIGAGNIGSNLTRLAVDHGYAVVLSNSRVPDTLADVAADLGYDSLDISSATPDEPGGAQVPPGVGPR